MYLKLNNTNINYRTAPIDDFMIFSGIIDSEIGPGRPTIIRSVQQMESLFGKDFTDYNYFTELLSNPGVSLYLAPTRIRRQIVEDPETVDEKTYKIYRAVDTYGFRFLSKSVGEVVDGIYAYDSRIRIYIEYIDPKEKIYRITIRRFDYEEIFEGTTNDIPGVKRIDKAVSDGSHLLLCEIIDKSSLPDEDTGEIVFDMENTELLKISEDPEEEATVYSGDNDSDRETNYTEILGMMFSEDQDNVYADYLLLHNLNIEPTEEDPLPTPTVSFETLLSYSKTYNFQVLLERKIGDSVIGSGDKENRIICFYKHTPEDGADKRKTLTYRGWERPGYYTFIRGLLSNSFSWSGIDIIYYSPQSDAYEEEDITQLLRSGKINYMVYNNYKYYFKEYFNGEDYVSTLWMRFAIGKVYRELMKHKWSFLGNKTGDTKILENINSVLGRIQSTFSIVKTIEVEEFNVDAVNNKLDLTIHTEVNDLADNDMELDITINY